MIDVRQACIKNFTFPVRTQVRKAGMLHGDFTLWMPLDEALTQRLLVALACEDYS